MVFNKKVLKVSEKPAYPDRTETTKNRRLLLSILGVGAASLITVGCQNVSDTQYNNTPKVDTGAEADSGFLGGVIDNRVDTGSKLDSDEGYLNGAPPGEWDTETELKTSTDDGYLAGGEPVDIDTDTQSDTSVKPDTDIDTGYLAGDIAPPEVDTETNIEIDTGFIAGGLGIPDWDTSSEEDTGK